VCTPFTSFLGIVNAFAAVLAGGQAAHIDLKGVLGRRYAPAGM
jgi:hypothetical protein